MSRGVRFDARLAKTQTFDPDDDEEPMVRRSTTLAEKRAIYSHTRALLAKIRFQRPLGDERPSDANDANDEKDQERSGTLDQSAVQHWGKVRSQNSRARTNWKKLREFVGATKKVRKSQDVMQIWLQVHQENTQRKLLEALTEFIQSEALRAAEAAEAAELFRAAEAAAAAAAEAKARKEAEEAARAAEREKREIFDIHAFSKQAATMMESLAQMQKEQDQLLREVEELQANMNLSSRRAGRLVEKIQETDMAATVNAIRNLAAQIPESDEVWVDFASLPPPVSPSDHPLEQTIFGPYRLPVEELKRFVPRAPLSTTQATQEASRYTLMHLPEGHSFTGTMRKTEWDDHGRPLQHPELEEVSWSIPAGWHFIRHCRVIPEGFISPWAAAEKPEYRPLTEQLRRWCARLALREEVWLEFTLGSLRAECLLLADTMLTMHAGLVAVVGWNYFDRLWPLWEWAVFCARRGAQRVQLASDAFSKKAQVEYHRALRRISVVNASCRDSRDRPILLEALEKLFHCRASMEMVGFRTGDSESGPTVLKERMVDFSPVERFVRVTAIAVFAREAALANSRHLEKTDETGWIALAQELGYDDLWNALKKCKPWDWTDVVQTEDLVQTDLAYEATVEAWWEDYVVPELERERQRALLPP